MKLEDQVITLDQAVRLKELGVGQESLYYYSSLRTTPNNELFLCRRNGIGLYYDEKGWFDAIHFVPGMTEYTYSAFTVAELGIMLPDVDNHEFVWASFPDAGIDEEGLDIDPPAFSVFIGPSVRHLEEEPFDNKVYPTEAQARAAFLIYCIENKKITIAEINSKLCE